MSEHTPLTVTDAQHGEAVAAKCESATAEKRRGELVCRTMYELSKAIDSLEVYGLSLDTSTLRTEGVEQVLMTDVWLCPQCGETDHAGICPHTKKPHRRRLVRVAQSILYLIGLRVGRIHLQPAHLTERVAGHVQMRMQRRIVINPQLLLLAFYFASMRAAGGAPVDLLTSPFLASTTAARTQTNDHDTHDGRVANSTHAPDDVAGSASDSCKDSYEHGDSATTMPTTASRRCPCSSRSRSSSSSSSNNSRPSSQQSIHKRRRTRAQDAPEKKATPNDTSHTRADRVEDDEREGRHVVMERLTMECAQQLIDVLRQIRNYSRAAITAAATDSALTSPTRTGGGGGCGRMDASYALSLMRSFRAAWEQYLLYVDHGSHALGDPHGSSSAVGEEASEGAVADASEEAAARSQQMDEEEQPVRARSQQSTPKGSPHPRAATMVSWMSPMDRRAATVELLAGTREALLAAARQLAHDPDNVSLSDFVVLLYQRVKRLASAEELTQLNAELERVQRERVTANTTTAATGTATTAIDTTTEETRAATAAAEYARADAATTQTQTQGGHAEEPSHMTRHNRVEHSRQFSHSSSPLHETIPPLSALSLSAEEPSTIAHTNTDIHTNTDTNASDSKTATVLPSPTARPAATLLLPSDVGNTTASDSDEHRTLTPARMPLAAQIAAVVEPALPPDWIVDAEGRSRPPPDTAQRRRREVFARMEFKARHAYEAVFASPAALTPSPLSGTNQNSNEEEESMFRYPDDDGRRVHDTESGGSEEERARDTRHTLGEAVESQLAALQRQLNQPIPDTQTIPTLLRLVEQELLRAVPARVQRAVAQELRDTLDYCGSVVMGRSMKSCTSSSSRAMTTMMGVVVNTVRFVAGRIAYWGAPAMAAVVEREAERVCAALQSSTQEAAEMARAVVRAFRFLFMAIRRLQRDVAHYSLNSITALLRHNAVDFIRDFVLNCLPPPADWTSTVAFLRRALRSESPAPAHSSTSSNDNDDNNSDHEEQQHRTTSALPDVTALSEPERALRAGVRRATMDLLRSGGRTTATRWAELPAEGFYFEKAVLFRIANAVQECTLLLLLEGTVSSILSTHGMRHGPRATTLKQLHTEILALLARDIRLDTLHRAVVDFLDRRLGGGDGAMLSPPTDAALTVVEEDMIRNMINKMTNTEDVLYMAFERKVLSAMERVVRQEQNVAPLGLVSETVRQHGSTLRKMLDFNWEVYAPFYREILPLLTEDSAGV